MSVREQPDQAGRAARRAPEATDPGTAPAVAGVDGTPVVTRPLVVEPADVTPDLLGAARTEILVVPPTGSVSGPVVLGMAASTGDSALRAAVRESAGRGAELQVVRAWSDPDVDPGVVRSDVLARWDELDTRLRSDAEERLGRWQDDGGAPARTLVVMDSAPEALALFTRTACLLVIGHRTEVDPGPVVTLARIVGCPMLIVPDDEGARPAP